MTLCMKCRQAFCSPGCPANDNAPAALSIYVASDWELRRRSHVRRLAIALVALGLSRRGVLDWLASVIFGHIGRGGVILWPHGRLFDVPDTLIDDTFTDPSGRWLSSFGRFGDDPPRQNPQRRVIERLRLLDLALRIDHAATARRVRR